MGMPIRCGRLQGKSDFIVQQVDECWWSRNQKSVSKSSHFLCNQLTISKVILVLLHCRVPLDLRSVVYCTAIRHGGDREWQFLWERYSKSNVGTEKTLILSALGCSREIWLLQRYLDWTLDESTGVRKQDRTTVFKNVARNDAGLLLAKSFLFDNVEDIYKK